MVGNTAAAVRRLTHDGLPPEMPFPCGDLSGFSCLCVCCCLLDNFSLQEPKCTARESCLPGGGLVVDCCLFRSKIHFAFDIVTTGFFFSLHYRCVESLAASSSPKARGAIFNPINRYVNLRYPLSTAVVATTERLTNG